MFHHVLQRRFPSILAKTLPPSTMGFGWRGTIAVLLHLVGCFFHHGNKAAYPEKIILEDWT